ncbi:MAG: aspartate-semialdehyde dehydrogenase [Bacteroidota bacterium]|nr:aspartate-semialdehyde dehydrogenase [Bacteroidota bacterium]
MRIAIIGITGMVGQEMLSVLEERKLPFNELIPVASKKSTSKIISFKNKKIPIINIEELLLNPPKLALFSAGAEISKKWAPKLAELGCKVIDNSSYWRMCSKHKLIIPEINGGVITKKDMIIANPNCSTIQMVMALNPLHSKYKIKRVVISTYQSISGTGKAAIEQFNNEKNNKNGDLIYPHKIYQNVLPQCDVFTENGYTKEEMKLINETQKIMQSKIKITATAVRVPILRGHSESLNITFEKEFDLCKIREIIKTTKGLTLQDDPSLNLYPMPIYCQKKNEVFVGRIRRDFTQKNTLNMWVVSDNLRKGAATNTIQIAEYLLLNNLV